jgi:hypothetical protein
MRGLADEFGLTLLEPLEAAADHLIRPIPRKVAETPSTAPVSTSTWAPPEGKSKGANIPTGEGGEGEGGFCVDEETLAIAFPSRACVASSAEHHKDMDRMVLRTAVPHFNGTKLRLTQRSGKWGVPRRPKSPLPYATRLACRQEGWGRFDTLWSGAPVGRLRCKNDPAVLDAIGGSVAACARAIPKGRQPQLGFRKTRTHTRTHTPTALFRKAENLPARIIIRTL